MFRGQGTSAGSANQRGVSQAAAHHFCLPFSDSPLTLQLPPHSPYMFALFDIVVVAHRSEAFSPLLPPRPLRASLKIALDLFGLVILSEDLTLETYHT